MPRPSPRRRRPATGRLARYRHLTSWAVTLALALLAGTVTTTVVAGADDARRAWGERRTVAVAAAGLEPGTTIAAADLERRELPIAVLPPDVVHDPTGRVVTSPILAGEAVVEARVGDEGVTGVAALVPEDHVAVAVALDAPTPPLQIGDRVDVLAPGALGPPSLGSVGGPAVRVARGAVVVHLGDTALTVAVGDDDAAAVAAATLQGPVAVVLTGVG